MQAGRQTRDALEAEFGAEAPDGTLLRQDDGTVDRKKLGAIVFANKDRMTALNAIVWPAIAKMVDSELCLMRKSGKKLVLMEAAILLEADWAAWIDEVWMVGGPPAVA
eukprot:SAG31_NODE_14676_length_793_cov_1.165706_1_plen_107_part_10